MMHIIVLQSFGEKSVDYLMKHAFASTPPTVRIVVTTLHSMLKSHKDFMQKYKSQLEKLEQTSKDSQVKDTVHEMVLVLEGKTYVKKSLLHFSSVDFLSF